MASNRFSSHLCRISHVTSAFICWGISKTKSFERPISKVIFINLQLVDSKTRCSIAFQNFCQAGVGESQCFIAVENYFKACCWFRFTSLNNLKMYKSDSANRNNYFTMVEIFFILSTLPFHYGFSIRPNLSSADKLGFGLGSWNGEYRTPWSPVGPAILEKCDRADDGEDIIDCVRLTIFFKDIGLKIVFIRFSDECLLYSLLHLRTQSNMWLCEKYTYVT